MARSAKVSGQRTSRAGIAAPRLLAKDHEAVKHLFRRYDKLGVSAQGVTAQAAKQRLFAEIDRMLGVHAKIEEEIFYPAVREEASSAGELVREAVEEHQVVKALLHELGTASPADEQFDATMKVLRETVERHIEEEERELFPKAATLGEARLRDLGRELQARKEALGHSTLSRIVSGVSELIFGSTHDDQDEGATKRSSARATPVKAATRSTVKAATRSTVKAATRSTAKKRASVSAISARSRSAGARKTAKKR